MEEYRLIVSTEDEGMRLDKYLSNKLSHLSRSYLQSIVSDVVIEGAKPKSSLRLKAGQSVQVFIPDPEVIDIKPVNIPLNILYEDDDLLVVDKPKGMPVHPAAGHWEDTLVNALMHSHGGSLSGINGKLRPGIVHRIDMDTTGSLIVCKNDEVHRDIARQIETHSFLRKYVGIVHGRLKEEGEVNAPIGRDLRDRKKMAVVQGGKEALTRYRLIECLNNNFSFAEFTLESGRTHQIRVHMSSIGHPILGDEVYGPKKCPYKLQGQTLHAMTIGFIHPKTGESIRVDAPLPDYFDKLLKKLGYSGNHDLSK